MRTQESSESERFLAALRELVGQDDDDQFSYVLLRRDALPSANNRDRLVGWYDNRGLYLLPGRAREIVEKARGRDYLGNLSDQTLHAQLARQGHIASSEKGRHLQQIRVRGQQAAGAASQDDSPVSGGSGTARAAQRRGSIGDNEHASRHSVPTFGRHCTHLEAQGGYTRDKGG